MPLDGLYYIKCNTIISNLAALNFDRLVLLDHGSIFADGPPGTVITKETIQKVFSTSVEVSRHPKTLVQQIVILPPDLQSKKNREIVFLQTANRR
jgi:ABC-type cobalamin/Fe3+-siderophores transport system ATPase subunit